MLTSLAAFMRTNLPPQRVTGLPLSAPGVYDDFLRSRFLHVALVSAYDHVKVGYAMLLFLPGAVIGAPERSLSDYSSLALPS